MPPAHRQLPQDADAEEVICSGLASGGARALAEVADVVQPCDFAHPAREAILTAALELDAAGKPVGRVSMVQELTRLGLASRLEPIGGPGYLYQLAQTVVPLDELRYHAGRVRDLARRRRVIVEASLIVDLGYREDGDPVAFLAEAQRRMNVAIDQGVKSKARTLGSHMLESSRRLEHRHTHQTDGTGAISTGFTDLNQRLTGGLRPGRVITVAGRPGAGKTSLGIQLGVNASRTGAHGYMFSLEMLGGDLADRILVQEARVDAGRFAYGRPWDQEWRQISEAAARLHDLPIWIDDSTDVTLSEMRAKARRWRAEHPGPAWILVDYLQLLGVADVHGSDQMSEERIIARFSKGLSALAKELQVAVIQVAALNRDVEKRGGKPKMSDLRGSGQIEYDSGAVLLIWHHAKGCRIEFGKNRFGDDSPVELTFTRASTRFDSATVE